MGFRNNIEQRRVTQLDGLRGIASLAVVSFHFLYFLPEKFPEVGTVLSPFIVGRQGVQLFFVISGFVIMMSIQGASLRGFVASRISRLYPTYWAALIITFVVATLWLPRYGVTWTDAVANLTMFQKFLGLPDVDGTYWTLAVELSFYIQCAALSAMGLLTKKRLPKTLILWLAVAVAVVALVNGLGLEDSAPLLAANVGLAFNYIPFFVSGIAVLHIFRGEGKQIMYMILVASAIAMQIIHRFADVAQFGFVYAAVILIVLLWRPLGTTSSPLIFLGEISYALYVIHEFIGFAIILNLMDAGWSRWAATALAFGVVLGLATLLTKYVDKPLRRPLRNLIQGKPGPVSVA